MANRLLFMVLSPLVGHVVDTRSLPTALGAMGVVLAGAAFAFYAAYRRRTSNLVTGGNS
jgi:hypothetical protein